MSAASGASSCRAMRVTSSDIEGAGRSSASTRDKATEPMIVSRTFVSRRPKRFPAKWTPARVKKTRQNKNLSADLEIDRARKRVGDRRPFLDVGHQRVDLALGHAFADHVDL